MTKTWAGYNENHQQTSVLVSYSNQVGEFVWACSSRYVPVRCSVQTRAGIHSVLELDQQLLLCLRSVWRNSKHLSFYRRKEPIQSAVMRRPVTEDHTPWWDIQQAHNMLNNLLHISGFMDFQLCANMRTTGRLRLTDWTCENDTPHKGLRCSKQTQWGTCQMHKS